MECVDCGEELPKAPGLRYCPTCGGTMKLKEVASTVANAAGANGRTVFNRMVVEPGTEPHLLVGNQTEDLLDFFGDNFRNLMENYLTQSTPVISQSYLKTLGKVEISRCCEGQKGKACFNNSTILIDASVQLEMELPKGEKKMIKFSCVPASFSPVTESSVLSGTVVRCDELCKPVGAVGLASPGASDLERLLAASAEGAIVLLTRRGTISFAQKALVAQRYLSQGVRVAAVVVVQSVDKWPFVMADSAREVHANSCGAAPKPVVPGATYLDIPVVMISKHDGLLLEEYLAGREGRGGAGVAPPPVRVSVQVNSKMNECSICQELMEFPQCCHDGADGVGQGAAAAASVGVAASAEVMEIYKLPCNHCYHVECVTQWLQLHNTCPMCRYQCPAEATSSATAAPAAEAGGVGDMYA